MITPLNGYPASREKPLARSRKHRRVGAMMLLVLVLVACLTVAVYAFTSQSNSGLFFVNSHRKSLSQRLLAESALNRVQAQLDFANQGSALDPKQHIVSASGFESVKGKMAVCQTQPTRGNIPLGLSNESAKLNLHYLASKNITREMAIAKLLHYRGMNSQIAEAIVNEVRGPGPDGQVRTTGDAVPSKRLLKLRDLLRVPGVTDQLLFGEDGNGNGILDQNENDGDRSEPFDNADGVLQSGWAAHWTVLGGEGTIASNGTAKIRLNQSDLALLYDQLITRFPPEEVRFVIAWRSAPATYESDSSDSAIKEARKADETARATTLQDRIRQQLGNEAEVGFAPSIRAGIQLGTSRAIRLPSLQALSECKVQIAIDGSDQVLASPFSSDTSKSTDWLQRWEEWTTLSDQPIDESRININQASFETLMTIQGMTESVAMSIIRTREARNEKPDEFKTVNWLVARGLINNTTLRRIAPECTTGGSVQSGFAVGQLEGSRTCSIIRFTIDSRFGPSRLVRRVDLPISSAAIQ
jgi:hypothetical protein